jgi:hypothetical protein
MSSTTSLQSLSTMSQNSGWPGLRSMRVSSQSPGVAD